MGDRHQEQFDRLYQHVQSEWLYRLIFDDYPDAVFAMDPFGQLMMANAKVKSLVGYSSEELQAKNLFELILPDDLPIVHKGFEACLHGLRSQFEVVLITKFGNQLDIHVALYPIEMDGYSSGVYGIAKDIRKRKHMERSLLKSRLLLEQTQRVAKIGLWEFDPSTSSSRWTHEVFEMFGLPFCDVIDYEQIVPYIHPDDRSEFIDRLHLLVVDHQPRDIEYRICRDDGNERILYSKLYEGMEGEVIGTVQDVTEQKKAERMVRQAEKLSAVGQLAAGVAHEIRNPLTALRGFLQLLEQCERDAKGIDQADRESRYLSIMKSELARIELIVNELLVYSKPQAIRFTKASIAELLQDVVTLLTPQALVKNVKIEFVIKPISDKIECDVNQLKQLFVNLIKNAIEAMPSGGVVTIGGTYDKDQMTVFVEDEGEGVPPEVISRMTDPFFSTKESGTGLGLMVCHRIVEAHFGHMNIGSQVGVGTRVQVSLPVLHHELRNRTDEGTSSILY